MESKRSVYSLSTLLTEAKIDKLTNVGGLRPLFVRDTRLPGFGLKVSSHDTKSFFVEARRSPAHGGTTQRYTLGRYPFLTVSEARKSALEALKTLRYSSEGIRNPSAPKADLRSLADAFLAAKESTLRSTTLKDYRMVLKGSYFAAWMSNDVASITRRYVLDTYERLCEMHGPGMANKAMRVLSSALNYAKATVPSLENWPNPIAVLTETRSRKPLRVRNGHIPIEALPAWTAAIDIYVSSARSPHEEFRRKEIRLLLQLLLMTGMRSNEARSIRWSDIDLIAQTIQIRQEVAKNHREVLLPLNRWLVEQLSNRTHVSDYVFPNPSGGYIRNVRRPLKAIAAISNLAVTPHDLRRTFATYLDMLGTPFGVIKQLMNHASSSDITHRYIQKQGLEHLRPWSDRLVELVLKSGVATPIGTAA